MPALVVGPHPGPVCGETARQATVPLNSLAGVGDEYIRSTEPCMAYPTSIPCWISPGGCDVHNKVSSPLAFLVVDPFAGL
jgi:hypothetical protein